MTDTETLTRSVAHGVFTLERTYPAVTPRQVFDAFATEAGKAAWFSDPNDNWDIVEREFDFRVGGRETLKGRWKSGMESHFQATYWDIVPGERIVYAYSVHLDGKMISVSLATFEFKPAGAGAKLIMTEQGAFLDGRDNNETREQGSRELIDKLSRHLEG